MLARVFSLFLILTCLTPSNKLGDKVPVMSTNIMRSEITSENRLLSENELLTRLPVSRRTLYALRRAGRVPYIKLSRRVLYDWETVRGALITNERSAR